MDTPEIKPASRRAPLGPSLGPGSTAAPLVVSAPETDVTAGTETPKAPEPPSSPAVIPTDAGLPCGGMAISTLKPAQLAMLVSKVARLVHDDGDRWVPLLAALQAERGARLARGQRPKLALIPPAEADVPHVDPPTREGAP